MRQNVTEPEQEVKRLQRCISDLVSVLALPCAWNNGELSRILETFFDALVKLLDLDFLYAQAKVAFHEPPIEVLRIAESAGVRDKWDEIRQDLHQLLEEATPNDRPVIRRLITGQQISILPLQLGIEGGLGLVVVGCQRLDFPQQTERIVMRVAANQLAVMLQQVQFLSEQRRVALELNERVAQRTAELAAANYELRKEIAERKEIEEQLRESEAFLLDAQQLSHTGSWKHDLVSNTVSGTPEIERIFAITSQDNASSDEFFFNRIHPDDREGERMIYLRALSDKHDFESDYRIVLPDGSIKYIHNTGRSQLNKAGEVVGFLGTAIDLTEQHKIRAELEKALAELKRSEAKLWQVIDTIPSLAWCNLPDGSSEFLSKRWHAYTGLSPEESHGWGWQTAFHCEDLPLLMKRWQELLISGEPGEIESRLRRFDGVYRWFLIRVEPFRDEMGNIVRWYGTSTDIHDRKQTQDELERSEERYRVVVETASDAVISMDESGVIIFANAATKGIFGYEAAELIGKPLTVLMPEAIRKLHEAGYKRYLETGERHLNWQGSELTAQRVNGEEFPAEVSFGEMTADGRKIFTGFIRDITEKKRAEEAVLASQDNLRLIIDTMPVLAWSAQADGRVDFFNQRWLNYTGLSPSQAENWGWAQAFHPDDMPRVTVYWQSMMGTGESGQIEARLRQFDGNYRWFIIRAEPLRDESGAIVKWYGTNTDIDDRKRAEEAVRERELNLRQITETIPEMLWSATPDGTIDYCNGRLLDYTGLRAEEVMRDGWMRLIHPDDVDPAVQVWNSSIKTGNPYRVEMRTFHAADQAYRWCLTSALPLLDEGRRIVKWHGTVVDIHDWKKAQEEIRNTQAELAKMMRVTTLGQLTASIAHEVNQPLSGIITNANTCLRMLDSDSPNVEGARETARRTLRDGNRASEVIARLRTLFNKKEVVVEPVDLNEAAREVIALLLGDLQNGGVILRHEFTDNLPIVKGDRIQLQQVILNLLRNASDAMSNVENRPKRLVITTEQDGEHVCLTVKDSGIGFEPAAYDRLFESFFTTKREGMGIGLSVSRSIIEAHGGRMSARANDGPGATFAFSIPCEHSHRSSSNVDQ
jgi:PAS domain S-box-containing protein